MSYIQLCYQFRKPSAPILDPGSSPCLTKPRKKWVQTRHGDLPTKKTTIQHSFGDREIFPFNKKVIDTTASRREAAGKPANHPADEVLQELPPPSSPPSTGYRAGGSRATSKFHVTLVLPRSCNRGILERRFKCRSCFREVSPVGYPAYLSVIKASLV